MSPLPLPILTLRLSSPSFLETILTDAGHPVYSTETYENETSLSRCDNVHGLGLVASIRWPMHSSPKGKSKEVPSAQVFLDGGYMTEDELLKRNCLNTSRKFYIPGHSHSLKWKRVQGMLQCMSSSGTLVAVFEPAILTARARLNVFVASLDGLPEHQGHDVSPFLLNYLIVTALLLITHPEDWRGLAPSPIIPTSELPHLQIPQLSRQASFSTLASPITSAYSESPYTSSPSSPSSEYGRGLRSCRSAASFARPDCGVNHMTVKEEVANYEPPPPYEEIQWTVRVRQPRRRHA